MKIKPDNPSIILGDRHTDQRGIVGFVNDFNFFGVKRFYTIQHPEVSTIRAWQGHRFETKYFYVVKGSFCIAYVEIDDWISPSDDLRVSSIILDDASSRILKLPPGYANGLRALIPDSIMMVFSDKTLSESFEDSYRFDSGLWYDFRHPIDMVRNGKITFTT